MDLERHCRENDVTSKNCANGRRKIKSGGNGWNSSNIHVVDDRARETEEGTRAVLG